MFQRFKTLKDFGGKDIEQLQDATVAVVGLGATGSVIAEHLARHGVNLVVIDRDYLEPKDIYSSNIYRKEDCDKGLPKAKVVEERLSEVVNVRSYVESLGPGNTGILEKADLIMDGTDNMETRFLINDYSKKNDTPWIYTAAIGEKGYSMIFDQKCFNCVFENINAGSLETCETAGIMREISTISASISSRKAVRLLSGKEVEERLDTVSGESFDVESSGCEVCRGESFPHLEGTGFTGSVCGENKYQIEIGEPDPRAFDRLRESGKVVADNDYLVRVESKEGSIALFHSGRAIVEARDKGHAEALLSEKVGL
ncbi:MAG: ThiF family adenylyltransferase [Candidatus Nanohaloarchaea archaeon]